jgi:hypothetical protein
MKHRPQFLLRESLLLIGAAGLGFAAAKAELFQLALYCLGFGMAMLAAPVTLFIGVFLILFRWQNPLPESTGSRFGLLASWMWMVFVAVGVLFSVVKNWNMPNQFGGHAIETMMLAGAFSVGAAIIFPIVFFASSGLKPVINAVLVWLIGMLLFWLLLWRIG